MVQRYAPKVKKASLEVKAVTHRPVVYFVIICFANVLPTIYKFIRVQAPDELSNHCQTAFKAIWLS